MHLAGQFGCGRHDRSAEGGQVPSDRELEAESAMMAHPHLGHDRSGPQPQHEIVRVAQDNRFAHPETKVGGHTDRRLPRCVVASHVNLRWRRGL